MSRRKIGDFYWMASNLKTQHLNDGTPIPVIEGGCSAWDGQTEPAACIFMNKSENEEKYGLLYNFYTVATGKLCPEGWTVPDWEQMDALPYGSIAQNVALMAPDDNWTAPPPTRPIRQGSAHCRAATRRGPSGKEAAPISGHPTQATAGRPASRSAEQP
ncbi:MAG: FISUMP domain-containing protein [Alistipes sp.]